MTARVVQHEHVVRVAGQLFDGEATVDMDVLADRVGVSRATLYRVVGSRERLLGDVLWEQGRRLMAYAERHVDGTGPERLVQLARIFNGHLVAYAPLRRFLREQPVLAHHVLFLPEAALHRRFVALWRDVFAEAAAREGLLLPFDVDELAFLWVRTGESMLYADLMSGLEPQVALAERVQRLLLTADVPPVPQQAAAEALRERAGPPVDASS